MSKNAIGLSLPFRLGKDGYFESTTDTLSQIKSNLINLFLTKPGERRFNNQFGTNLYNYLFEQQDLEISREILLDIVKKDVSKFINGVIINDVTAELSDNQTNNSYNKIFINIKFTYKQTQSNVNFELNI